MAHFKNSKMTKRLLYDSIKGDVTVDAPDKVVVCKRVIRELSSEYVMAGAHCEFLWACTFPQDICHLIMSFITTTKTTKARDVVPDLNQLLNIGLVCKMWWRGPPGDAWYMEGFTTNRPFTILSYMRQRFIPKLPIPIKNSHTQRVVHFEGFEPGGKWAYSSTGAYYTPIAGVPSLLFRVLAREVVIRIYVEGSYKDDMVYSVPGTPLGKDGKIGHVFSASLASVFAIFKKNKWTIPIDVTFQFGFYVYGNVNERYRCTQQMTIRLKVYPKATTYNIRKAIKNGSPSNYTIMM